LNFNICFPQDIPFALVEKNKGEEKGHQTYKLFGTCSMNQHVETKHHELLFAYLLELVAIVDGISRGSEEGSQLL